MRSPIICGTQSKLPLKLLTLTNFYFHVCLVRVVPKLNVARTKEDIECIANYTNGSRCVENRSPLVYVTLQRHTISFFLVKLNYE